jgi:hypothetical protein
MGCSEDGFIVAVASNDYLEVFYMNYKNMF